MINLMKILAFILIVSAIFFIENIKLILIIAVISAVLMVILKVDIIGFGKLLLRLAPLLIIATLINLIYTGVVEAMMILIRLIVSFSLTYIFSKMITPMEIANGLEMMFFPLKLFKVDTKYISLMISIAICMIPSFRKEISTEIKAIHAKGQMVSLKNIKLVSRPLLISLMKKTNEIEKSLLSKAYK